MADDEAPRTGSSAAHAEHDPELVATLLDRDLPEADQAAGSALIESCVACRAILSDLRSLATVMADLPVPARARDFTLTPETAARLSLVEAGEPLATGARLTGEMTHSTPRHEAHDRLLIASLVDRSISDAERDRAEAQLTSCAACAQLHEDLVALAAATRALPAHQRTRDFTLAPAEAARLRGSRWRRLVAAIGSTRDVFSRPLAIGLTTLGVAGLLVATVPMPFGSGGATAERAAVPIEAATEDGAAGSAPGDNFTTQSSAVPALPDESGPAIAAAGPSAEPSSAVEAAPDEPEPDVLFGGGELSPLPGEPDANRNLYQTDFDASGSGPSPMVIVAGLLLLMGLSLFGLRWTARRLGDG